MTTQWTPGDKGLLPFEVLDLEEDNGPLGVEIGGYRFTIWPDAMAAAQPLPPLQGSGEEATPFAKSVAAVWTNHVAEGTATEDEKRKLAMFLALSPMIGAAELVNPAPKVGDVVALKIGDPVRLSSVMPYYVDWEHTPLWVAGIHAANITGAISYTLSEHWPPRHNGDLTSDFADEYVVALRSTSTNAEGE